MQVEHPVKSDRRFKANAKSKLLEYKLWHRIKHTLCLEWQESFETFYKDVGNKISKDFKFKKKDPKLEFNKNNFIWIHREKIPKKYSFLTYEFLSEKYLNDKNSVVQICKDYHIRSHNTVIQLLRKYDIPIRNQKEAEEFNKYRCEKNRKYVGQLTGSYWCSVKHCARVRNFEFSISQKYAWELFLKQDRKCTLTGRQLIFPPNGSAKTRKEQTASLDRKNSLLGYTEDNVQWIHKDLQTAKMDLNDQEFIDLCKEVYFYSIKKR